jgi:hypothetical protein
VCPHHPPPPRGSTPTPQTGARAVLTRHRETM